METVHIAGSNSPIGRFRVASTEAGLAYVELPHSNGRGMRDWMQRYVLEHRCVDEIGPNRAAIEQILEYLASERIHFDFRWICAGRRSNAPSGTCCSRFPTESAAPTRKWRVQSAGRPRSAPWDLRTAPIRYPSSCRATGSSPPTGASGGMGEVRISRPDCSRWRARGHRAIGCSRSGTPERSPVTPRFGRRPMRSQEQAPERSCDAAKAGRRPIRSQEQDSGGVL